MNNPNSSNTSEDNGFIAQSVDGHFTYTIVKEDHNIITISVNNPSKENYWHWYDIIQIY